MSRARSSLSGFKQSISSIFMASSSIIVSVAKDSPLTDLGLVLEQVKGKRNASACGVLFGQLCFSRKVHVVVSSATGPAAAAGIEAGDEIISVNGEAVDSNVGARTALQQANHGIVQCEIQRGARSSAFTAHTAPPVAVGVKVG